MPIFASVPTRCPKRKFEELEAESLSESESVVVPDVDVDADVDAAANACDSDADELTLEEYDAQFDLNSDEELEDLEYHYPHCPLECESVHEELEDLIANAESDVQLLIDYSLGRMSTDPAVVARLQYIFDRYKMQVGASALSPAPTPHI